MKSELRLAIFHLPIGHANKDYRGKLNQMEKISSLVRLKNAPALYENEKQKLKKYSVVALRESEKVKRQICLEGLLHPCLLRGGDSE